MKQHQGDKMIPDSDSQAQAETKAASKKPYIAPVLVEYGNIAKLTQGTFTRNNDGGVNTFQQMGKCL
ncbi:MAG: lasso RiPP family leader peptide-containing protein [Burkholderiales bacterium]|nr:lasso RiPP family leader peptide-containing protein [Burkholderiales bacterium]